MNERDLGWLEGIIDGEGYLGLTKMSNRFAKRGFCYHALVTVANTNLDIIERARNIVGSGAIIHYDRGDRWKDAIRVSWGARTLRTLLPQLTLTGKAKQCTLLIEAMSLTAQHTNRHTPNDSRLEEIYHEIRALNKRGK